MPKKELREFVKVQLNPHVTKEVTLSLDTGYFGYYSTLIKDWYCESGNYQIFVGSSTYSCSLKGGIYVNNPERPQPDFRITAPDYYALSNNEFKVSREEFEAIYGKRRHIRDVQASRPYTSENTIEDISHTFLGKFIRRYANKVAKDVTESAKEQEGMMASMIGEMPFFTMVASGDGMLSEGMLEGVLHRLNAHYLKGLWKLLKEIRK